MRIALKVTVLVLLAGVVGGADAASQQALTIYNQDFAVVRETLPLDLKGGVNSVRYDETTSHVEPNSVVLRHPADEHAIQIVVQNYPVSYYWSAHQPEWATDIAFRSHQCLASIYPQLAWGAITTFSSPDVMRFLGRGFNSRFCRITQKGREISTAAILRQKVTAQILARAAA